jgi:3-methyladenine DNA glycosylase AlkC
VRLGCKKKELTFEKGRCDKMKNVPVVSLPEKPIKRVGARNRAEVPSKIIEALNQGIIESTNLVELLVVDFAVLMAAIYPKMSNTMIEPLASSHGLGITKRMALAGKAILDCFGFDEFNKLKSHPSDIVRSWACYMLGSHPGLSLAKRLQLIRPLANDPHSSVREWGWIAIRPYIADNIGSSMELLQPWVLERSEFLRRYAVEITRPRGVWCSHINDLKKTPKLGLPLLEPIISDPTKYVQDSVSNWLNDAFKTSPEWVQKQCHLWQKRSSAPATLRICKRALRGLAKS